MGNMFAALFAFLTSMFRAGENAGVALENVTGWAREASGVFKDEATADRELKLIANNQRRQLLEAELKASEVKVTEKVARVATPKAAA